MLLALIFTALGALINRARGWGAVEDWQQRHSSPPARWRYVADALTGRVLCALYAGLAVGGYAYLQGAQLHSAYIPGLLAAFGFYFWALSGWGDYFDFTDGANQEIEWIEALTHDLPFGPRRDTISMALRMCYAAPFFIGITWALYGAFSLAAAAYSLVIGGLATGVFSIISALTYRCSSRALRGKWDDIAVTENLVGAYLFALTAIIIAIN